MASWSPVVIREAHWRLEGTINLSLSSTEGQYQYNGLHWRIVIDADHATPAGFDRRTTMYYSAGWQLLQEDIDDHTNNESPDGVNSRSQEVWGLRYIDDAMVRLLDKNLDGDCRDSGELFWQLSDAQFSTVAVIDKNAVLQERVSYTSYGVGTHRWPHEVNNTGGVTTSGSTSDYGVIDGLAGAHSGAGTTIDETTYNVAADLNRDGVIDSTDTSIFTSTFGGAKSALASGIISDPSGPDNVFGYDGYVYNPDQGLYTVRFRWYNPTFGRWLERDQAEYTDGMSQYAYVRDQPFAYSDPLGLLASQADDNGNTCGCDATQRACNRAQNIATAISTLCPSLAAKLAQRGLSPPTRAMAAPDWLLSVLGLSASGEASAAYVLREFANRSRSGIRCLSSFGPVTIRPLGSPERYMLALKAGNWVGNILGILGVVLDSVSAAQRFRSGDVQMGKVSACSAAGGAVVLVAGRVLTVPAAGAGAGAGAGAACATVALPLVGAAAIAIQVHNAEELNKTMNEIIDIENNSELNGHCNYLLNEYLKARRRCLSGGAN